MLLKNSLELKILHQSVTVGISSKEDEEYYLNIAEQLNKDLNNILHRLNIPSDATAYVRLLFKLAVENDRLKNSASKLDVESALDRCISKLDI